MRRNGSRRAFSTVAAAAALLMAGAGSAQETGRTSEGPDVAALYARHCAICHGVDGAGDGPASRLLFPPARNFGKGMFRIVSTLNGVPTDEDLYGVIARGLPGSAMPGFGWLGEDAVRGLAEHVREFAIERLADELQAGYHAVGQPLSDEMARRAATWRMQPAELVDVPPPADPVDDEVLARGREVYLERCAACHGADGTGRAVVDDWHAFDELPWARDLTDGVLEGGATHGELVERIVAGMPGAGMPPQRFADTADLQALVAYVRSLLPPDAGERGVTNPRTLVAPRVDGELPVAPDDQRWGTAPDLDVVLMPLTVRPHSVRSANVAALHDGARLAIRITWHDASRDDSALAGTLPDACAVQFSEIEAPPLFGMGTHEHPRDIWHWAAFRFRDVAGGLDLLFLPDGRPMPPPDAGEPAPGEFTPAEEADRVRAEGIGETEADESVVTARPMWRDGTWSVVLVDEMADGAGTVELRPGQTCRLTFAVWNGTAGDRGGRKSISVWHELEIEP